MVNKQSFKGLFKNVQNRINETNWICILPHFAVKFSDFWFWRWREKLCFMLYWQVALHTLRSSEKLYFCYGAVDYISLFLE